MSSQITIAFQQEFKVGIDHLVQQDDSRLRAAVTVESVVGKQAFFDQLGATTMTERIGRHADTVYTDTPHARRMCPLRDYDVADLVDSPDKVRVLNDPTNPYSVAMANAALRNIDDVIIEAMLGTAQTGETGASPIGATASITSTGADLTTAVMISTKVQMDLDEVPSGDRFFCTNAYQLGKLLAETDYNSSDYNTIKALVHGETDRWLGFEFIRSERLAESGTDIKSFAWHKSGIVLGVGIDTMGRISELPTKRYSTQVFYCHTIGAVRMEEKKVVQLLLDKEAA